MEKINASEGNLASYVQQQLGTTRSEACNMNTSKMSSFFRLTAPLAKCSATHNTTWSPKTVIYGDLRFVPCNLHLFFPPRGETKPRLQQAPTQATDLNTILLWPMPSKRPGRREVSQAGWATPAPEFWRGFFSCTQLGLLFRGFRVFSASIRNLARVFSVPSLVCCFEAFVMSSYLDKTKAPAGSSTGY